MIWRDTHPAVLELSRGQALTSRVYQAHISYLGLEGDDSPGGGIRAEAFPFSDAKAAIYEGSILQLF